MRPSQRFVLIALSIAALLAIGWVVLELDRTEPASTRVATATPPPELSDTPQDPHARTATTPLGDPHLTGTDDGRGGPGARGELRIAGRVVGRGARPIEGARLRISLETTDGAREIAHATSGADGTYSARTADLFDLDEQSRRLATVCVAVDAAGFQPQTRRQGYGWDAERAADPVRTWTVDFRLAAGNTLSGRVVDAKGHGVRGASVVLVAGARSDELAVPRPPRTEVLSGSDGRFEIGFVSGGRYHVWARKDRCGSARIDELELAAEEDRKLGDVALAGAGTLAGTVRYPDGSPVRDLEVWAVPESLAHDPNALALAASNAAQLEGGDGLVSSSAITDARGEFRVEGLRESGYALRSAEMHFALEPRASVYTAPADSIRLVLDAYRLRVRVRSQSGAALEGAVVTCTEVEPSSDGTLETGAASHSTAEGRDALATFEVEPDQTYALAARASGSRQAEELVILAPGEFELERTLVLQPARAQGRLRVVVSGARGESLSHLRVALLSPLSGQPLAELGTLRPDENGWLPPLTPGRYGVEIGFEPSLDPPTMHFPVRSPEPIEIDSGRDHELSLSARAGGRLRITISIDGPAPRNFGPPDLRTAANPDTAYDAWLQENGARAELVTGDGQSRIALHFIEPPLEPGGGPRLEARLAPGASALADRLLEPGIYTLRVEASGFRAAELVVEVQPAGVRPVEIFLRAE
jgi:protocatechuate 3,4-dioxygenase beta subunit